MTEFQERSNIRIVRRGIEVPRLKYFRGKINHNMPLLLNGTDNEGNVVDVPRTPMTLAQLLNERVNGTNVHDRDLLRGDYPGVAFAEIVDPSESGEIKYALYSQSLVRGLFNSLNQESNIKNRGLVITPEQYAEIPNSDCMVVPKDIAADLRNNGLSHPDKRREIWVYGAEGDESLVDGNLDLVKQRIGGDISNRMGIFPSSYSGLRSWYVNGLDGNNRSDAYGRYGLGLDLDRFVGVVAPEAQSASQKLELSDRVISGFSAEQIGRLLREEVGYTDSKTEELLRRLGTYETQQ